MQKKPSLETSLVIGVIVLLGLNIAPIVSSLSLEKFVKEDKLGSGVLSDFNISTAGTKGWNDWFISNVAVTFVVTGPGVVDLFYNINNGSWTDDYVAPITIACDGYYTVYAYVAYENGTQSPIVSVNFKIDKTAPQFINFNFTRIGILKWKFTADVYDNMSGVNSVLFFIDCRLVAKLTSPPYEQSIKVRLGFMFMINWKFRQTGDWGYLPNCRAYDNAGNFPMQPII